MAENEFWVVNRDGFNPKRFYRQWRLNPHPPRGMSGPDVFIVAEMEKIIRGVVMEADTGTCCPGVNVRLTRKNLDQGRGKYVFPKLQAKTDAKGRYEIHGACKAKSYLLEIVSNAMMGYTGREIWIEDTPGYQPVTADIRVRKAIQKKPLPQRAGE